jgi:hypothetical protein
MFICIHSEYIGRNVSQSTITFHSTHQQPNTPHEVVDVTRQNGGPHSLCLFVHENHPKWRVNNIDRRIDGQMRTTAELEGLTMTSGMICDRTLAANVRTHRCWSPTVPRSHYTDPRSPLSCKEPSSTRRQKCTDQADVGAYGKIATTLPYGPDRP